MTEEQKQPEEVAVEEESATEEEPVVGAVKPAQAEDDVSDNPITPAEVSDAVKHAGIRVRDGFLKPAWRLGRRYLKNLDSAADEFAAGVAGKKDNKD